MPLLINESSTRLFNIYKIKFVKNIFCSPSIISYKLKVWNTDVVQYNHLKNVFLYLCCNYEHQGWLDNMLTSPWYPSLYHFCLFSFFCIPYPVARIGNLTPPPPLIQDITFQTQARSTHTSCDIVQKNVHDCIYTFKILVIETWQDAIISLFSFSPSISILSVSFRLIPARAVIATHSPFYPNQTLIPSPICVWLALNSTRDNILPTAQPLKGHWSGLNMTASHAFIPLSWQLKSWMGSCSTLFYFGHFQRDSLDFRSRPRRQKRK